MLGLDGIVLVLRRTLRMWGPIPFMLWGLLRSEKVEGNAKSRLRSGWVIALGCFGI